MVTEVQSWDSELRRLEAVVDAGEADALRARWKSGHCMLELRGDKKQLPHGVRALLYKELQVGATEVTARMAFAKKYPTEDEPVAIATRFKSWDAIRRRALPSKAGEKKRRRGLQSRGPQVGKQRVEFDGEMIGQAAIGVEPVGTVQQPGELRFQAADRHRQPVGRDRARRETIA